jgi:hypothetical protein
MMNNVHILRGRQALIIINLSTDDLITNVTNMRKEQNRKLCKCLSEGLNLGWEPGGFLREGNF